MVDLSKELVSTGRAVFGVCWLVMLSGGYRWEKRSEFTWVFPRKCVRKNSGALEPFNPLPFWNYFRTLETKAPSKSHRPKRCGNWSLLCTSRGSSAPNAMGKFLLETVVPRASGTAKRLDASNAACKSLLGVFNTARNSKFVDFL